MGPRRVGGLRAQARVVHEAAGEHVRGRQIGHLALEVATHVEHELGFALELLATHQAQVVAVVVGVGGWGVVQPTVGGACWEIGGRSLLTTTSCQP